ncbi:MAG: hypothetical protein LBG59_00450 [Candidatus Peribacteria bacterium]|jgi:hypothetical protein|nr:hypothetical protein [Candidatus Peribacteria bacterium]
MAEQTVEQLKQEVASEYFKKYKKELGWLQSLALYPIEKEVKNILSGQVNLPEKFDDIQEFGRWGKILGFISKDMASDLLNFMKEKRLEIEKRKTESALLELKSEVLGEKKPETPLPSSSPSSPSASSTTENPDESVSIASPATTDHESSAPDQSADTEQPK